jgi:hypothetical protein
MFPQTTEQPSYILQKHKPRALIPPICSFIILSIVFYLSILLNLQLLEFPAKHEELVRLISLILILLLDCISIYLAIQKSKQLYLFYLKNITHNNKQINYTQITQPKKDQNIYDKIFHTYSLQLSDKFTIHHIPQETDIQTYIQQMSAYNQRYSLQNSMQSSI